MVNQSVWRVTGSSERSSARIASSDSSMRRRWSTGSMPITKASVGRAPGPVPNMTRPLRQVVEQHHAVGHQPGVVVGERDHAGAELDVLGPLGRHRDEDLRAADQLVAPRVVLAEPGLVEAEPVELDHPLEVVLEGERRVLAERVERGVEDAEAERALRHRCAFLSATSVSSWGSAISSRNPSRTSFTSAARSCWIQWPAPSMTTLPRWSSRQARAGLGREERQHRVVAPGDEERGAGDVCRRRGARSAASCGRGSGTS